MSPIYFHMHTILRPCFVGKSREKGKVWDYAIDLLLHMSNQRNFISLITYTMWFGGPQLFVGLFLMPLSFRFLCLLTRPMGLWNNHPQMLLLLNQRFLNGRNFLHKASSLASLVTRTIRLRTSRGM